jgi:glycosyltransferase involved in cell wall biosynthesis
LNVVASTLPRIYWLTTEFFPPETGGTGIIAARLAQGLAERDAAIQVITRQTVPPSAARERIGRLTVRRIRPAGRMKGVGWRAFPAMLGYLVRIAFVLASEAPRYDIVIISGMKTIPLAAIPLCRLLRKKCAIRIESPFEIVEPISTESLDVMNNRVGRSLSRLLQGIQRATLLGADRVIAISDDIAAVLLRLGCARARIVNIPNAIDLDKFKPIHRDARVRLRESLGFRQNATVVVYAGRLSRAKGVMMMMETWPKLLSAHPSLFLVLVGTGQGSWDDCEAEIAEMIAAKDLANSAAMVGHSDRVHEYLQAADLYVSPSDYEGFGLSIVEALACALPVVSTAVGIAPQVIRNDDNGFLCPPKDPYAFGAAMTLALARQNRWPEIGERARGAVLKFDAECVVDQYLALCRELHPL